MNNNLGWTVFEGEKQVVSAALRVVLTELKARFDQDPGAPLLVFEDATGKQVDFDLRGTLAEVLARYEPAPERVGPGRPRLGVVAREVTLLPRHWEWLEQQPAGASAAIRRLVDEARKRDPAERQKQGAVEAAGRFLTAMAGNLPGYEEACRALYARDWSRFGAQISGWPEDIRLHTERLVREAAAGGGAAASGE